MEVFKGNGLRLNAPEFFRDQEFVAWLNNGVPKLTWHKGGQPDEWSDVVVLVDPSVTGEGTDSDMPQHIWAAIVGACKEAYGPVVCGASEMITVRLTNVAV